MKEVAVIAFKQSYANYIKASIEVYFGNKVSIKAYSVSEIDSKDFIDEKYIVLSGFIIFKRVYEKIKETSVLQVIHFTLSQQQADMLKNVPTNNRILLVNIDHRMCMEVITQIYEAGYKNLDLVPYYGDENSRDKSIVTAITPNEMQIMPPGIMNIINIGDRVLDVNSVADLAAKMGIDGIFNTEEAQKARNNVLLTSDGIEKLLGDNENLSEQIKALIELMDDGIVLTNLTNNIYLANQKAKAILKNRSEIIEDFNIADILPELKIDITGDSKKQKTIEKIISIDGVNIITRVSTIYSDDTGKCNIITLRNFDELEEKQHMIRSKISGTKHEAKYIFSDIKGESAKIKETIMNGVRMAKSDSSVLITGESGTGKEVFAQSIHNLSPRNKFSFVALNCSAIPENLLESEMFGYEDGAFTGAKKGGKIGLFELAHMGTIFLDEICEMPLTLQSKLLRVLEEKKVARIGSLKLIDVNIRVIAATNRNIKELIKEKKFREDLYYRLNVLPLEIPPLRERKGDIPILIEHFMKMMSKKWRTSPAALQKICKYSWPGNVRELRNVVEFMCNFDKDYIELLDLPKDILNEKASTEAIRMEHSIGDNHQSNIMFLLREGKRFELFEGILKVLSSEGDNNQKWGRIKLEETLNEHGYLFTETEVRYGLRILNEMGYIKSTRGRGGSQITSTGFELLGNIITLKSVSK
ncbi:MAG: Sigma-54 dependent transcriptional regulator [Clostridiales bacterium 38_11]|nr:MAG: Sigma-54 dependent transcriptional regulator [Clostridiales bacterium 38_11]HBH13721.1 hypothetical protein [Clostridiales bacterium]